MNPSLVQELLEEKSPTLRILYGVATGNNTVLVAGSTVAVDLPALSPVVDGDYVAVLATGADRLILGKVGGAFTRITTGAVVGVNFTLDDFVAWHSALFVQFRVVVTRTTSAISRPASGNITNTTLATLPVSCRGSSNYALPCGSGHIGRTASGLFVPSSGVVEVAAIGGTTDLAIGEQLTLGGLFLVND